MLRDPARLYLIADPYDDEISPLPVLVAGEAGEPGGAPTAPTLPDHNHES